MKIEIITISELEVDIEELKKIGDFDVDDIFRCGKSVTGKLNATIIAGGESEDEEIGQKVIEILENI